MHSTLHFSISPLAVLESWEGYEPDRNVNYMTAYNKKLNLSLAKMLNY